MELCQEIYTSKHALRTQMATSKLMEQCTNPNKYFEEYYLGLDFKYDPLVSLSLACGPEPGLSVLPWESGLSIDS